MSYSGQTASSSWSRAGNTQINAFIHTHTHTLGQLLLEKINISVHFPQKKKRGMVRMLWMISVLGTGRPARLFELGNRGPAFGFSGPPHLHLQNEGI